MTRSPDTFDAVTGLISAQRLVAFLAEYRAVRRAGLAADTALALLQAKFELQTLAEALGCTVVEAPAQRKEPTDA